VRLIGATLFAACVTLLMLRPSDAALQPPAPAAARLHPPIQPRARFVAFNLLRGGEDRTNYDDYDGRCAALQKLMSNLSFDEVAFHEGNVPAAVIDEFASTYGARFVDVRLYGGFASAGSLGLRLPRVRKAHAYSIGYKHMCRFFALQWMHALSLYDYAMRVDDDVIIQQFLMANPFIHLMSTGAVYGYGLNTEEKHAETVLTMDPWLRAYVAERRIRPTQPLDVTRIYFTNFFVTRVDWWHQPAVQQFLFDVDSSMHIYNHRWGDAPLQTTALHLFGEADQIVQVYMDYSHASTNNRIENGQEILTKEPGKILSFYERAEYEFKSIAPCLIANHAKLLGHPFNMTKAAVDALNGFIMLNASLSFEELDAYDELELSYIVKDDLVQGGPLPSGSLVGADRRNALSAIISGNRSATDQQLMNIAMAHPCSKNMASRASQQLQQAALKKNEGRDEAGELAGIRKNIAEKQARAAARSATENS
jgi:hypothetical protein